MDGVTFSVVAGDPALLGESPAYDAPNARLLWTDMFGQRIRELCWQPGRSWQLGELAAAVVPRSGGGLVVLTRTDVVGLSDEGERDPIATLDGESGIRFNDAKCDPQGALVAGWIVEELDRPGAVLRIGTDGEMETLVTGVQLANGMAWSPDGSTFYLVDSATLTVEAFDYAPGGPLSARRTIAKLERGKGAPNGVSVDDE